MEDFERIPKLIANHLQGNITAADKQELDTWIKESDANRLFFVKATNEQLIAEKINKFLSFDPDRRLNTILRALDPQAKTTNKSRVVLMKKLAIAACFLLIAGAGIYYIMQHRDAGKKELAQTTTTTNTNDLPPGTEKAVLTLSDGTKITLDNTANGTIAQQGNTVVLKEDGLLAYNTDRKKSQTEILYNTLTTPKGGEYRSLVLSDGTKVWLNSVSSIRYPTAFIGKERIVEITGEAYFEVAKNSHPFRVLVAPSPTGGGGMAVEVLGTHFNINSYADEAGIKTTLLEGLVKISSNGKASFLKPGQQALVPPVIAAAGKRSGKQGETGEIKIVDDANTEAAVAWKNGLFKFQKADIKTIMRQVSRWYDVDVEYEKDVTETFSGTIPRNVSVSKLFTMLELTGHVHFKIEGKKIIVMP